MPVINNFGDVATQGNTQVVGNVTIQGTGTSSWSSATSAVTLAGTLAVSGTTTTTGVILPLNDGISGIGGPARRYNNVFTANANIYSTANIATANVSNLNVFSLATFVGPITVQDTTRLIGATTVTGTIAPTASGVSGLGGPSAYFANAFLQVANVGTTAPVLSLNVLGNVFVSNTLNVTNILAVSANLTFLNLASWMNISSLNVFTGANVTTLTVSGLSNLQQANIVSSNLQTMNIQYANVATINVWNGANVTTLTVSGLSNLQNANIVSSNLQTTNIQYANVATINVTNAANITTLTVSGLSNLFNANIVSSNLQTTNIQYANVATINVTNAANITTLTVSGLSNLFNANIVSSNLQTTNIQYANVATINVTNAANITTLTVSGLSNLFNANIVSSNLQTTNIQYANVATINVWNGANVTTLTVSSFANVNSANIVGIVNSTLNVSTQANLQYANMISANVVGTMNVNGLLSARYLTGNGSALMNLHASNISNGVLNFNATNGLGANGIAISGILGGNGQILASTGGVGAGVQWIGPATGIWSNVVPSITPPPYPIYYSIGNVGVGNTLWTSFGTGFNTYPGAPLDVYGGSGTFSNVSDAPYYGTIRIQNNPGTHSAPGGLEFKCGTSGVPGPGGGTGHRLVASELTIGSGVAPLIWQVRSGTWNWSNALSVMCGSAYSGYVGIGTMSPLYPLHVYQNSNTAVSSITAQFSNANQAAYLYLSNTSGTATTLYLNGPNNSSDGPANSATLRNDAGDLRLASRLNSPYIYLQTSTTFVGINTSTPATLLHAVGPGATLRLQSNSSADTIMELYDSGGTKRSNWAYSVSGTYVYNQNDTQDKMRFYNGAGGNVSLQPIAGNVGVGTTTSPQRLLHVLGSTNGTGPCLIDYNAAAPTDTALLVRTSAAAASTFYLETLQTSGGSSTRYSVRGDGYVFSTYGFQATNNTNGGAAFLILTNTNAGNAAFPYTQWQSDTGSAYIFKNSSTRPTDGGPKTCTFRNDDGDLRLSAKVDSPYIYLQNSSGNVGLGTTSIIGKFHIYEGTSVTAGPTTGTLVLDHGNSGGNSSICFPSRVNYGSDYGYIIYQDGATPGAAGESARLRIGTQNDADDHIILEPAGNVGINTNTPQYKFHVYNGDSSFAYFGPNATWGAYMVVGAGTNQVASGRCQVITTNGNLHLDAGTGQQMYLNNYNTGAGINSWGAWTHNAAQTISGIFTANGNTNQMNRTRAYSSTYGASYGAAAIEVREYNLENATGGNDMSRAPRIGFHWAGVVASSIAMEYSGRIGIWNNPGNAYERFASGTYYNSGSIGIRMDPGYALDCAGSQAYFMQSSQSGYGWNRFTGYSAEGSRSQVILQSYYSDLIVCSSEFNGTHGSTISLTTNSPYNNDYRKFVINVGNWSGYGTGGYGDRMSFGWKDGAYVNPHTYVTPDDSAMCIWGRNKCVGINNVGSPGYNLHVNGTGYFSTQCYVGDWFRVYGSGGLYFETHGGGWQMTDSTWIRAYNGKAIYATNTIATTGDVIAYYSDMRLKKNIVPIEDALEKLMGLSTFTYEANEVAESLGYKTGERNTGFSAQEVKAILPEVIRLAPCDIGETNEVTKVTESKTGENYMTLLYDKMLPFVVKALQEESTARRELQTRVEALEKLLVKE